jgi:hypothetical protein
VNPDDVILDICHWTTDHGKREMYTVQALHSPTQTLSVRASASTEVEARASALADLQAALSDERGRDGD